jgi:hypothetical protein
MAPAKRGAAPDAFLVLAGLSPQAAPIRDTSRQSMPRLMRQAADVGPNVPRAR